MALAKKVPQIMRSRDNMDNETKEFERDALIIESNIMWAHPDLCREAVALRKHVERKLEMAQHGERGEHGDGAAW
jgi:hypothetical protein